jgi:hypothetical protein
VPVDREIFEFFPALKRPYFSIQVSGNFLPRIQMIVLRRVRVFSRLEGQRFAHRISDWQIGTWRILPSKAMTFNVFQRDTKKYDIPRQFRNVVPCRLRDFEDAPSVPQSSSVWKAVHS